MDDIHLSPEVYLLFARLLEYPTAEFLQSAAQELPIIFAVSPPAQEKLAEFVREANNLPITSLEEIYTRTFDLQGICYPYVGHHLFGESQKRSLFMARLNQEYWETGFEVGVELPDHLPVILRYLARSDEGEFNQILIIEGLLPALEKMLKVFGENAANPYEKVLQALLLALAVPASEGQAEPASAEMGGLSHA